MSRSGSPKWLDGRRYCPGCRTYLAPELFPARKPDAKRRDGLGTYCYSCQRERDRLYQITRRKPDSACRRAVYRETTIIHGAIPTADRDLAEKQHQLGREVIYLGGTRLHAGIIVGLRQDPRYGMLVWVDFSDNPLRISLTETLGVTLIKSFWLAVRAPANYQPAEPEAKPYVYQSSGMPLWVA